MAVKMAMTFLQAVLVPTVEISESRSCILQPSVLAAFLTAVHLLTSANWLSNNDKVVTSTELEKPVPSWLSSRFNA